MTDLSLTAAGRAAPDDTVRLVVGGQSIVGWTEVRITRRAEGIPNDFDVGLTSSNPDGTPVQAVAGQPCQVHVGTTPVITGYIDRDINGGSDTAHQLSIRGRGRCADLVDCSAEWPGGQISGANALQVAAKLAEPYGITVILAPGAQVGPAIPQFNLNYGETAQQLIDRVCTYGGLLYYEDEGGDLMLAQVGATAAASGFVYGQNVQDWSVENGVDERFAEYVCSAVSTDVFGDLGDGSLFFFTAYDQAVTRHRRMYLVAESVTGSLELCKRRALWEAARRSGRGTTVRVTADSWRDSAGTLWTPNTLAPVTVPGLRLPPATPLVISEVTLIDDLEQGKVAKVSLMPPQAFSLQPIQIQPTFYATGEVPA